MADKHHYPQNERKGDWMQTYSGKMFWPLDPRPDEVDIRDIAHALSLQCRFNGMCTEFYSVAEHSVRVAEYMEAELKSPYRSIKLPPKGIDNLIVLLGLLHDATEAYTSDVPRPLKQNMPEFKTIEHEIEETIYAKYYLTEIHWEYKDFLKQADNTLLVTEARDLMLPHPEPWCLKEEPLENRIIPYGPKDAERMFLDKFYHLQKGNI